MAYPETCMDRDGSAHAMTTRTLIAGKSFSVPAQFGDGSADGSEEITYPETYEDKSAPAIGRRLSSRREGSLCIARVCAGRASQTTVILSVPDMFRLDDLPVSLIKKSSHCTHPVSYVSRAAVRAQNCKKNVGTYQLSVPVL